MSAPFVLGNSTARAALLGGGDKSSQYPEIVAKIVLVFSSLYYLLPGIAFAYLARRNMYIAQRNVGLTLSLVAASELMLCFQTAIRFIDDFPCALFVWVASICWPLIFSSLVFRSLRLVFLTKMHRYRNGDFIRLKVENLVIEAHSKNSEPSTPSDYDQATPNPTHVQHELLYNVKELPWWLKHRRRLTDKSLTIYQAIILAISVSYCAALTVIDPDMNPRRLSSDDVAGGCAFNTFRPAIVPAFWMIFFTLVMSPIILYSLRGIHDNYKIKRDLLWSTIVATLLLPATIIWSFFLPRSISKYVEGVILFGWLGLMGINTICVLIPVIEAVRLEKKFKAMLANDYSSTLYERPLSPVINHDVIVGGFGVELKLTNASFQMVLNNPLLLSELQAFAERDFTTENVLFLKAYKILAEAVLQAMSPNTNDDECFEPITDPFSPSFRLPSTLIPVTLYTTYRAMYETFFKPGSELELNLPSSLMSKVREVILLAFIREEVKSNLWLRRQVLGGGARKTRGGRKPGSLRSNRSMSRRASGGSSASGTSSQGIKMHPLSSTTTGVESDSDSSNDDNNRETEVNSQQQSSENLTAERNLNRYAWSVEAGKGIPANVFDEVMKNVMEMLYLNTYTKWIKEKRK